MPFLEIYFYNILYSLVKYVNISCPTKMRKDGKRGFHGENCTYGIRHTTHLSSNILGLSHAA